MTATLKPQETKAKAECPKCHQRVTTVYVAGRDALNFHLNSGNICAGSYLEAVAP